MEKDLDQVNKNDNKYSQNTPTEKNIQKENKTTSDKISENREIGGLSDRDDAPGSGISTHDSTEHTVGNP